MASRPDHSAASLTSPWSLTHSASTPSGTRSWGMPGATLTQASRRSRPSTNDHGGCPVVGATRCGRGPTGGRVGERDVEGGGVDRGRVGHRHRARGARGRRGWLRRPPPGAGRGRRPRRSRRRPRRPPGRRRSRSRGRSASRWTRPASRAARCRATGSRVACSRPSGVKYIRVGEVAELGRGPAPQLDLGERRGDLVGGCPASQRPLDRQLARRRSATRSAAAASRSWPSSVSSQRKESRSTSAILSEHGRRTPAGTPAG